MLFFSKKYLPPVSTISVNFSYLVFDEAVWLLFDNSISIPTIPDLRELDPHVYVHTHDILPTPFPLPFICSFFCERINGGGRGRGGAIDPNHGGRGGPRGPGGRGPHGGPGMMGPGMGGRGPGGPLLMNPEPVGVPGGRGGPMGAGMGGRVGREGPGGPMGPRGMEMGPGGAGGGGMDGPERMEGRPGGMGGRGGGGSRMGPGGRGGAGWDEYGQGDFWLARFFVFVLSFRKCVVLVTVGFGFVLRSNRFQVRNTVFWYFALVLIVCRASFWCWFEL